MERVDIVAQLGHDERHAMRHQPGDEVHVAAQPVELGDQHRALAPLRPGERRGELRPPVERVSALAGLDLGVGAGQGEPLAGNEARNRPCCASGPSPERPCFWVDTRK
jgi:hypothetical protein